MELNREPGNRHTFIFEKVSKQPNGERKAFSTNDAWTTGHLYEEKETWLLPHTIHKKKFKMGLKPKHNMKPPYLKKKKKKESLSATLK